MASSFPPRDAIAPWGTLPSPRSRSGSLSPRMERALAFIEDVQNLNLTVGPTVPDDETLSRIAAQTGLGTEDVLAIYLAVLHPDPESLQ